MSDATVMRRRVATGPTLLIGTVIGLIGWLGNSVAAFVTEWSEPFAWFAVPVAAVGVSIVTTFANAHLENRYDSTGSAPSSSAHGGQSVGFALIAVILVIGLGGFAATWGVRYAVGYFSGNESGTDRLVRTVPAESKRLTLTVTKFEETRHFTRVTVIVDNQVGNTVTLPLTKNCTLVGGDSSALEADGFKSDWSDSIAPGVRRSGTITFAGHLPDGVRRAQLVFSTVFEQGFDGPRSMEVSDIRLRPRTG